MKPLKCGGEIFCLDYRVKERQSCTHPCTVFLHTSCLLSVDNIVSVLLFQKVQNIDLLRLIFNKCREEIAVALNEFCKSGAEENMLSVML